MTRANVLVADDKENVLGLMQDVLKDDFNVQTANSGRSALALALVGDFDVVVADVRMPGLDGFELLGAIKSARPEIEVVLMTAYGGVDKAVEAMRAGAFDYLTKPFEPEEVVQKIGRAAGRRGLPVGKRMAELSYREAMEQMRESATREYVTALLREFGGSVTRSAERAGIERESLHRLMKRYGLRAQGFRPSK